MLQVSIYVLPTKKGPLPGGRGEEGRRMGPEGKGFDKGQLG